MQPYHERAIATFISEMKTPYAKLLLAIKRSLSPSFSIASLPGIASACKAFHALSGATHQAPDQEVLSKSDELLRMDFEEFAALAAGHDIEPGETTYLPTSEPDLSMLPVITPSKGDIQITMRDDTSSDDQTQEADSIVTDESLWEDTSSDSNDSLHHSQAAEDWETFESSHEDVRPQLRPSRDLRGLEPDQYDRWVCTFCLALTDAIEECPACRMSREESFEAQAAGLPLPLGNILDSGQPNIKLNPVERDERRPWDCGYCGSGLTGVDKCFDCKVRRCVTDFIRANALPEPFAPCPRAYDPWQCRACGALTCGAHHCWYCDARRAATGLAYPSVDDTPDGAECGVSIPTHLDQSVAMSSGSWADIVQADLDRVPHIATQWECPCCGQWNVGPVSYCDGCGQSGWHNPHQGNYQHLREQRHLARCGLLDTEVLSPEMDWSVGGERAEEQSGSGEDATADPEWEDMDDDADAVGSKDLVTIFEGELAEQDDRGARALAPGSKRRGRGAMEHAIISNV